MSTKQLPDEIEISGETVTLDWDESGSSLGNDYLGEATHHVDSDELDEGNADGPYDGQTFEINGRKFRLGAHDYRTEDGVTTCSAKIYAVKRGEDHD